MPTRLVPGVELSSTPSRTAADRTTATVTQLVVPSSAATPTKLTDIDPTKSATGHHFSVSSGTIVGIAVGSTCAFLAMAFTAIFLILRRRRAREDQVSRLSDDFRNQGYPDVGLAPSSRRAPTELDSSPVEPKELAAESQPDRARANLPHPFRKRAKHISLNDQPVEMPA